MDRGKWTMRPGHLYGFILTDGEAEHVLRHRGEALHLLSILNGVYGERAEADLAQEVQA